jgi:hypothetical protein
LTNLFIKTVDAEGRQQLHIFNVVAAHGSPEYSSVQVSKTAFKSSPLLPTLSTSEILDRMEAGMQVAIARGLAKSDSQLARSRVDECLPSKKLRMQHWVVSVVPKC